MKKNLLLLMSLCIPLLIGAQDWKPLVEGNFYNYQIIGQNELAYTIKIDSVQDVGGFFVHHLNRIAKECDNCSVERSLKTEQYQFLNEEMVDQGDGIFLFGGTNNEFFRIYSQASISQVWNFDPINGITASILMANEMEVLGQMDSVKTIGLSNGQQILLSKNHGIVQFPDLFYGTDEMYSLIGISNQDLGFVTPDFHQIYNWSPGMVLMYQSSQTFVGQEDIFFYKHTVLDVETTADSVVVYVEEIGHKIYWDYGFPIDTTVFSDMNKRLVFYKDELPGVNAQINEVVLNPSEWVSGLAYAHVSVFENSDGRVSKLLGEKDFEPNLFSLDSNNPGVLIPDNNLADIFHLEYQTGLGITSYEIFIFEAGESLELIGYSIDGQEEGIILTDEELLFTTSTNDLIDASESLEVFPNPVKAGLQIRWDASLSVPEWVQIFDTQGRLVDQTKVVIEANTISLNTIEWMEGTYWVRLIGADWQGLQQIQKR